MKQLNQTQQAGGGFVTTILLLKEYRGFLQNQVRNGEIKASLLEARFSNYYKKINQ